MTVVPVPTNEPVRTYEPGSRDRASLVATLRAMADAGPVALTGAFPERRPGRGEVLDVRMPSDHAHLLGRVHQADADDVRGAIDAGRAAARGWSAMPFEDRAAIFLRAADLLAGPYRDRINAATMLGQGKTIQQAEIDAACELTDFLRFNVAFAESIRQVQPFSPAHQWNRMEYRSLEGFVYAITPFNFTAIAGNLPTSAALMGNVVLWKPSLTQQFSAHVFMEVLERAGLPSGVITMVPGHGRLVSDIALAHPDFAGIHFTGSTATFRGLWSQVAENLSRYRAYPRLVGETGGKDFVLAHASADPDVLVTALVRGAFEYSGQKCSAASRAYVPESVWRRVKDRLLDETRALKVGDVRDLTNFTSAVIDERAFDKITSAIDFARASSDARVLVGGGSDRSTGWYIEPTIIVSDNPRHDIFRTEYFGPVLGVHVYPDADYERMIAEIDSSAAYALTGSVIAGDRAAIATADAGLRHAAGNFYVNDKPTGAVVGQQPFGGARASGTNDKAGSMWNLIRWTSPRSVKETLVPLTTIPYPHQAQEE